MGAEHAPREQPGARAEVEHMLGRAAAEVERGDGSAIEAVVGRDEAAPDRLIRLGLLVEDLGCVRHDVQAYAMTQHRRGPPTWRRPFVSAYKPYATMRFAAGARRREPSVQ
jgi:hypothetical protein